MTDLKSLADQAWLNDARLAKLFDVVAKAGGQIRIAGGAVRNGLWGLAVSDIDAATTLLPQQTITAAERAGFAVYLTGMDHGTITIVIDGLTVEVTTLRHDVETDGRHAVVAFTTDWAADAARRDFTFNALYCDLAGTVFDETGKGLEDCKNRYVRFVGNADQRTKEDHLRILRFFRFESQYGVGRFDSDALDACQRLAGLLERVSAERKRVELIKLLCGKRVIEVIKKMRALNILEHIIYVDHDVDGLTNLIAIEAELGLCADGLMRLAMLTANAGHLRLSKADHLRFKEMQGDFVITADTPLDEQQVLLYKNGVGLYRDLVLRNWAFSGDLPKNKKWQKILSLPEHWKIPVFPVTGKDLINAGFAQGKELGCLLDKLEVWWMKNRFKVPKQDLIDYLNKTQLDRRNK